MWIMDDKKCHNHESTGVIKHTQWYSETQKMHLKKKSTELEPIFLEQSITHPSSRIEKKHWEQHFPVNK